MPIRIRLESGAIFPIRRWGETEDVGKAVAHLTFSEVAVDGIGDGLPRFARNDRVARDD